MSGLPVFAYCEDTKQVAELREFFIGLGAQMAEEGTGILFDDVSELVAHCEIAGLKLEKINEVEMTLNSLVSLMIPLPPARVGDVVRVFCKKLQGPEFGGQGEQSKAGAAFRVLSNLFHGFGSMEHRSQRVIQYDIYCCLLRVGAESLLISELPATPEMLHNWFKEWEVDMDKQRDCLRLLHTALVRQEQVEAPARIMIELLKTYSGADAEKAIEDARECVRSALDVPGTFLFDHLLQLRPVQLLKNGDPRLFQLLEIFVSGSLQDYLSFCSAHPDYVTGELKLDHQTLVHKMRILSLMSIGETEQEVEFKVLAESLHLSPGEELEEFIIKALLSDAVKAKMDQVNEKLLIGSVRHRQFEKPQWEQLRARLDAWATNLRATKRHLDVVAVQS